MVMNVMYVIASRRIGSYYIRVQYIFDEINKRFIQTSNKLLYFVYMKQLSKQINNHFFFPLSFFDFERNSDVLAHVEFLDR